MHMKALAVLPFGSFGQGQNRYQRYSLFTGLRVSTLWPWAISSADVFMNVNEREILGSVSAGVGMCGTHLVEIGLITFDGRAQPVRQHAWSSSEREHRQLQRGGNAS